MDEDVKTEKTDAVKVIAEGEGYRASSPNTEDREELAVWSVIMMAAMAMLIAMIRNKALNR